VVQGHQFGTVGVVVGDGQAQVLKQPPCSLLDMRPAHWAPPLVLAVLDHLLA
jgi:hypothetical protein